MKATLSLLILVLAHLCSTAENARYVTVTATNTAIPAIIPIQESESAEIVSCINEAYGSSVPKYFPARIVKNGLGFPGYPPGFLGYNGLLPGGTMVSGPAEIQVGTWNSTPSLLCVKITPTSYDPNKTLIIPPGTNQVHVSLESSTNLVSWSMTTNGLYGSPDTAHFFRIRMER